MKKYLITILSILLISGVASAQVTMVDNQGRLLSSGANAPVAQAGANVNNVPVFVNVPITKSSSESSALGVGISANNITFNDSQQLLANTPFFPLITPLIQGGRVGDITDQLPNFSGMKKLRLPYVRENGERKEVDPGETINSEKIITFNGWIMDRICLEDLWGDISKYWKKVSDKGWDVKKMRFRVYYKDKAKGVSANLGGQFGGSGNNGGYGLQGSTGVVGGYSSSWADPMYMILICEVI